MKNNYAPVSPKQPTVFEVFHRHINVEPLLELGQGEYLSEYAHDLDEAMLLLMEYPRLAEGVNADWIYNMYYRIREVRNAY